MVQIHTYLGTGAQAEVFVVVASYGSVVVYSQSRETTRDYGSLWREADIDLCVLDKEESRKGASVFVHPGPAEPRGTVDA